MGKPKAPAGHGSGPRLRPCSKTLGTRRTPARSLAGPAAGHRLGLNSYLPQGSSPTLKTRVNPDPPSRPPPPHAAAGRYSARPTPARNTPETEPKGSVSPRHEDDLAGDSSEISSSDSTPAPPQNQGRRGIITAGSPRTKARAVAGSARSGDSEDRRPACRGERRRRRRKALSGTRTHKDHRRSRPASGTVSSRRFRSLLSLLAVACPVPSRRGLSRGRAGGRAGWLAGAAGGCCSSAWLNDWALRCRCSLASQANLWGFGAHGPSAAASLRGRERQEEEEEAREGDGNPVRFTSCCRSCLRDLARLEGGQESKHAGREGGREERRELRCRGEGRGEIRERESAMGAATSEQQVAKAAVA
ncbi:hypothetical protein MPTK1_3g22850 [Marchantia polymorpha subsp. ruderalis]|uniref:Uncharacterized protein n=2 Tax=Marchantia polymorpha TaxID=3197 RepID=A0AAF6B3R3_MARPO|nr:hypothetical protein MARPO_0024s0062 [Marchantia polymorpha]BBN06647.1 hypothetical protein Mp_3g22850 [Marchantia polymorpha subsp. ruderalis]|eukprot:PTQ43546.1 hypothetical protein MARPO_0024s0062 [Marchantia polymorpha]